MELNPNFFGLHNKFICYAAVSLVMNYTILNDVYLIIHSVPIQLRSFMLLDSVEVYVYLTPILLAATYFYSKNYIRYFLKNRYSAFIDICLIIMLTLSFYLSNKILVDHQQYLNSILFIQDFLNYIISSSGYALFVYLIFLALSMLLFSRWKSPIKYFFILLYFLFNEFLFMSAINSISEARGEPSSFLFSFWAVMTINIIVWLIISVYVGYLEEDPILKLKKLNKSLEAGSITSTKFHEEINNILSKL